MVNSDQISLKKILYLLYSNYGSQGWWPLLRFKPEIIPPNRGGYTCIYRIFADLVE
ncbi:MAG: hypothetical protein ACTSRX_02960 [Promethearchaeota archaeon]